MNRIALAVASLVACCVVTTTIVTEAQDQPVKRPNVVLVMTDDQGYGDLGEHGNRIVRTPNLDGMAGKSAVLTQFYVSPVCTPTRACLMTGRYNYRTRAIDTFRGRAMMDTSEVTIAEMLKGAGYATGIFGKWHLGDCYPMRPIDQGFEMSLVHRGGGLGQPSDAPGFEDKYTDPELYRNGQPEAVKGYCTDVYFREAMKWADSAAAGGKPFFLYLPQNCPHGPFGDVPQEKYEYYKQQVISAEKFPKEPSRQGGARQGGGQAHFAPRTTQNEPVPAASGTGSKTEGNPIPRQMDADTQARVYAMIENIDDNMGRLLKWLDEKKLAENTLVIFMTDNGRATPGYNAGMRGNKSTVYEGGIRSPFFACWPGKLKPGVASDRIAAHIDLAPTFLEICGVKAPGNVKFDGKSIWPLLKGMRIAWPERTLFTQSHRGDAPVLYHNFAARTQKWKLVSATGFGQEQLPASGPKFELFDMENDRFEQKDLVAEHPEIVAKLKGEYEAWFKDVSSTRPDNYAPPRIIVGSPHEKTTVLTRQDWRGAGWGPNDQGHWEIEVAEPGRYNVKIIASAADSNRKLGLKLGERDVSVPFAAKATEHTIPLGNVPAGPQKLEAWVEGSGARIGVRFVEITAVR